MANSLVEISPISLLAQMLERAERRVGRAAWEAAEDVAARPRGQQLFRQADRLLELMERLVRALVRALNRPWRRSNPHGDTDADGDGRDKWGQAPMPLRTAVPLVIIVLPSYMAATLLIMVPYFPILIMRVLFGPSPVLEECWPTPTNAEKCLRRWRRRLRAIRYSGLRKMRILSIIAFDRLEYMLQKKEKKEMIGSEKVEEEKEVEEEEEDEGEEVEDDLEDNSLLSTVLLWWPITLLTLIGQILGLGDPWIPAFNSPALESSAVSSAEENVPKNDAENVSPRKRKFLDFQAEDLPTNQEIAFGLGEILHPTLRGHALEPDEILTDSYTDFSWEYDSGSDSDSGTLAESVDFSKSEIQPRRLSPLAKLLTDSPLSSDAEEDDPNYVPNPDEESGDEDDYDVTEGNEDDENEETCNEIESVGTESKEFIEMETKEPIGMESEKIGEMETEGMKSDKIDEMKSRESNAIESKKIDEIETKECDGKESKTSNEKETKEPMGKLFTEYENCDKTLTPRSAQSDL
ncbi:hypothetical protein R5R35_013116 [Gryllus longicercus]|uniref:Uncharacterized protein n=1 Tax=Gryllus longicercus TaxID=2509291 RepID=A0AAN9VZQ1_9ORTH